MNSTSSIVRTLATVTVTLLLLPHHEALAWGATGHRLVSRVAIQNLPAEIPAFLRTKTTADLVGELGREPDRAKGTGNSHDHDLDPGHFVNLSDDFAVAGVLPLDPLPATREDYDTALRSKDSNEYKAGFLPYSIIDGWQQLQKDFAYWRADVAAERSAMSKTQRTWFAQDRRLHEMLILRDLGYWSHFVADASQPMHISVHYDGWGDYPNPHGYTTAKGFHAAFEGAFVARNIRSKDIIKKMRPAHDCRCSIQTRTMAYLRDTHSQLLPLFELEKNGAFSANPTAGMVFTADRLAAAASELRDMIVAAWRTSEDSAVGYPPVPVRDVESGKVNPIEQMMGMD